MAGFPNWIGPLLPVAGVILSVTVFLMPTWDCLHTELRISIPPEFRKCAYGHFIEFERSEGSDTWKPVWRGREPFTSDAALAVAISQDPDRRWWPLEITAPASMPVSRLYRLLRELERAGVVRVTVSCPGIGRKD